MARKKNPPDPSKPSKGRAVVLPTWWFREATRETEKKSDQEIADEILAAAGRTWDRTVIGNFRRNNGPTIELAEAFCVTYNLPRFEWTARSPEEADAFRRTALKYDPHPAGDPSARSAYDSSAEQLEKQIESQTSLVESSNEVGIGRGRRTGRVGRGRT